MTPSRKEELVQNLLRQVEGWKHALNFLNNITPIDHYEPDEKKRSVHFSRHFHGDITPVIVTLPPNKRNQQLLLATNGRFFICSYDDDQVYFYEAGKSDLSLIMTEDVYATVIGVFEAERDQADQELDRRKEILQSAKIWHHLLPAQAK